MPADVSLSVWLVKMQESSAVAVEEISSGLCVLLPCVAPESLTGFVAFSLKCGSDSFAAFMKRSSTGDFKLLENIVAALAADPAQLAAVDKLVKDLEEWASSLDVFPSGFLEFRGVFREILESGNV